MAFGVDQEKQLLRDISVNSSPTDKYIADSFDDAATGSKYFGFVAKAGLWYIMRETITGTVSKFDYTTGPFIQQTIPDYNTAWTNRTTLSYTSGALTKIY